MFQMPLKITNKGVFFIAVSQFGMAFSFSFMIAFMPFYIVKISTFGPKETMLWIGMIIGVPNIIMALIAPFWGGLTSRFSPKLLFERGILCNGILILLMGFIDNLYLLLLLRIMQGAFGGVSTIGLVLISSLSPEERLHKDLSLFQNSLTAGQLMGPPLGTYTASLFGYRGAFVIASIIVSIFLTFCHHYVSDIPLQKKKSHPEAYYKKGLLSGWVLSLIATVQLTFLPSILPRILENFQLMEGAALNYAGIIIMFYTATAILGTYIFSRLSSKISLKKIITISCLSAAFFQVLLIISKGVWSFAVIRMIQTGFIAAIFPLTISIFARDVGGGMIGFLNSARFFGNAVGPLMATSVLAYSNLLTLYILIAGLTLSSLWAFVTSTKTIET
jgi:DHA1 family multidrug resistance protein-like MFS transporter